MQAGVMLDEQLGGKGLTPKHLRVGVNSAMVDSGSLGELLIRKGLITEAEYLDAICAGMNREVEMYERELTAKLGRPVQLRPGEVLIEGEPAKPSDLS